MNYFLHFFFLLIFLFNLFVFFSLELFIKKIYIKLCKFKKCITLQFKNIYLNIKIIINLKNKNIIRLLDK